MPNVDKLISSGGSAQPDISHWIALADEQFRKKDFSAARNIIRQGLLHFPGHPQLRDRLLIVDQRWNLPVAGNGIHLVKPVESDLEFFQRCYANDEFMGRFLPMGRKNQNTESIRAALKPNEFPVAHFRAVHWVIKKEVPVHQPQAASAINFKSLGLASLVDIQIAHRRAELLVGIPDEEDRKRAAAVIATLLIFDFAFNQIGLHKLTSLVMSGNRHSQKSTESIGFVREGLRRQHLRDPKSRLWLDCYENGLVEDTFRESVAVARLSGRFLGRDITLKDPGVSE